MNWLTLAALAVLIVCTLIGYVRGLLKTVFELVKIILALALAAVLYPSVTNLVMEHTGLYEATQETVGAVVDAKIDELSELIQAETAKVQDSIDEQTQQARENADSALQGLDVSGSALSDLTPLINALAKQGKDITDTLIDTLSPVKSIRAALEENNTEEIYQELGVDNFRDYLTAYLSKLIVQAICSVITFAAVILILQVISVSLDLISKLPVIDGINAVGGGAVGAVTGLIILWIGGLILTALSGTENGQELMRMVSESPILTVIESWNPLLMLLV